MANGITIKFKSDRRSQASVTHLFDALLGRPPSPTCAFGHTIVWTHRDGWKDFYAVYGCLTIEEARREAVKGAARNGWTPPRWWQWWRWKDTRITTADMANAHALEVTP